MVENLSFEGMMFLIEWSFLKKTNMFLIAILQKKKERKSRMRNWLNQRYRLMNGMNWNYKSEQNAPIQIATEHINYNRCINKLWQIA